MTSDATTPGDHAGPHSPPPPSADTVAPRDFVALAPDDPRKPPRWLPRALFMIVVTIFVGIFVWYALGTLKSLGVNVLIAFFIALALEPIVVWLVRHGWKRGGAAATALLGGLVVVIGIFALFGNLFVQQLVQLVQSIPALYTNIQEFVQERFDIDMPSSDVLLKQGFNEFGEDVASGALVVGTTIVGGIFAFLTIMLVTYYLLAAGPKFRAAICRWLTPNRQQEVLRLWEITQVKVSDFINSRIVLAALSSVFTFVFLLILGTDYALPLSVFVGVVSQFVPTIGTYIGGALPVIVALTSQGLPQALAVLIFIVAYQQLENLYFSPKVSARALEMNPAVSFVVVLAFGAVFGALGAFLSLPIAATIQAVANTYLQRHELVDSHMLHDPGREKDEPTDDEGDGGGGLARRRRANRKAAREAARTVDERHADGIE
ncbi:AI-2E family transporter [Oerskovia enterophila]|uniref:Pheromone autoinducer 2 transporter n=1 Tax=Oerskovia enterophila TaxID=43678 RepID=A0A161XDG8_9CELL|nr:AI-2E family transporter [Oerskovia enterophila]KZM34727.1 pheromone autoinducer 2 transporter [Oerskovia enterophila]